MHPKLKETKDRLSKKLSFLSLRRLKELNKIKHRSMEESEEENGDTEDSEPKNEVEIPREFTISFSPLLNLPAEIKNIIYKLVLARTPKESGSHNSPFWIPNNNIRIYQGIFSFPVPSRRKFVNDLALLRVSRQVYWEVRPLLYKMELSGGIDISFFQPCMVKTRGYALEPHVRHTTGARTLIEPGRNRKAKETPRWSHSLIKEKDYLCHPRVKPTEPKPERLWKYTCTYCKNHRSKFYTPYPGCDCPRSLRLIRAPPLAVVTTAKTIIIRLLWPHSSEREESTDSSQAFEDVIELRQAVSRLVRLIKLNVDVSGEPAEVHILVSSTGSERWRDFVLEEVCIASRV